MENSTGSIEAGQSIRSPIEDALIRSRGEVPVSTPEISRFLRGVQTSEEGQAIIQGGYSMDQLGFRGNGVTLGFDAAISVSAIEKMHRGAHVAEIFAIPSIRREYMEAVQNEPALRDTEWEAFFARPLREGEEARGSILNSESTTILPSELYEGSFDTQTQRWEPNPNYWEYKLRVEQSQHGWSDQEYQERRRQKLEGIKAEALQRMHEKVEQLKRGMDMSEFFSTEINSNGDEIISFPKQIEF